MNNNGNDQLNPHNSQNRQSNNALDHILQTGVTPEQYAQNARQLEVCNRMNALGLQVYLQRQNQVAEQRRREQSRLIQLAQQLANGSQQHQQQQILPTIPQVHPNHRPQPSQQPAASGGHNVALQIPNQGRQYYNKPYTGNVTSQNMRHFQSHSMGHSLASTPGAQQQHPYSSFRVPVNPVNPSTHSQRNTNNIGGMGSVATSAQSTHPRNAQPPKATTLTSVQHQPQYQQYSSVGTTGPQAMAGQGSTSRMVPIRGVVPFERASTLYHSWEKMHGPEKAAVTRDLMQPWQQILPEGQVPMHSAASSTAFTSTNVLQSHNQSQISNNVPNQGVSAPPQPHYRSQGWIPDPISVPSLSHLPAPAQPLRPPADNSAPQMSVTQSQENPVSNLIKQETPIHSATASHFPSTFPTAPSSQSQSILLPPEEKSSSLYTIRGLAASIKRSLNAERLAVSGQAISTSETPAETRRSPLDEADDTEAVDTTEQSELAAVGANEPVISPSADSVETAPVLPLDKGDTSSATVPSPFPGASVSQLETSDETTTSKSYQEPLPGFVPFSTLAGAVSFDNDTNYASVDPSIIPSPATSPLKGLTDSQQVAGIAPHDHMDVDVPLLSFAEASFNGLSFPTRTPTPPLSAMITPYRDDDGTNEKTQETPPSIPTSPCLDQVFSISPTSNGFEATVISVDEDKDRVDVNVTSPFSGHAARPEAQILHLPKVETHAFVRRTGLLDSPMEEVSGEAIKYLQTVGHPGDDTRKLVRTNETPSVVPNSGSRISLKPSMKSVGKPPFYVAVPPQPEWVRKAKRQEATKKGLGSEENRQRSEREYAENGLANRLCPRLCHWSGCQAVLNSMYTLKKHVKRHQSEAEPVGPAMTVSCQWKQCRMVCEQSSLLSHLYRHIEKEINCVYDDCDERFSRVQDLAAHERSEHVNDEPPPCALPQRPVRKTPVPLPETLPSYTVTTRPPSQPSISMERHARLGPWVLGMTFGHPVTGSHGDTRLTDKALAVAPTLAISVDGEMRPKCEQMEPSAEYDLLEEEPSVGSTRFFDDLDSVDITSMFRDGVSAEMGLPCALKEVASDSDEGRTQISFQTAVDSDLMAVEALL